MSVPTVVAPDISFDDLHASAPVFHAIVEVARSTPGELSALDAWVEQNRQPHPRNEELPANAPSVKSLIFNSKVDAALAERQRAA